MHVATAARDARRQCAAFFDPVCMETMTKTKTRPDQRFLNIPINARLDDAISELAEELSLSRAAVARLALRSFLIVHKGPKHLSEKR